MPTERNRYPIEERDVLKKDGQLVDSIIDHTDGVHLIRKGIGNRGWYEAGFALGLATAHLMPPVPEPVD